MLMAGAALVLAIVCVNLAGLTLGRNTARSREVAIRLALGAGRWTVLRQFAMEGLTMAVAGGTIGVLAAFWGVRLLVRYAPITLPRLETVTIDFRVLLFQRGDRFGRGPAVFVAAGSFRFKIGASRKPAFHRAEYEFFAA